MDIKMENEHGNLSRKGQLLRTVATLALSLGLGLLCSMFGPTLTTLEQHFGTDTTTAGIAVSFQSGGFLTGSLLSGVLFDRFNSELQFSVICFLMGISLMIAPFSGSIYAFMGVVAVQGIACGFVDTVRTPYMLTVWQKHRAKNAIIQAMHFTWAVGFTLSPFIVQPFLGETVSLANASYIADYAEKLEMSENILSVHNNMTFTPELEDMYAGEADKIYLLLGSFPIANAIIFGLLFATNGPTFKKIEKMDCPDSKKMTTSLLEFKEPSKSFKIVFFTLSFIFFAFYAICEVIPTVFVSVFATKGFAWSTQFGALVMAIFGLGIGIGRMISIPFAYFLPAFVVIVLNLVIVCMSCILMLFIPHLGQIALMVSVLLLGVGLGPIFGAQCCWAAKYIQFNSFAITVCVVGALAGKVVAVPLTGFLMENIGYMSMVYVLITSSCILAIIFIIINIFTRCSNTEGSEPTVDEKDVIRSLLHV